MMLSGCTAKTPETAVSETTAGAASRNGGNCKKRGKTGKCEQKQRWLHLQMI